MKWMVLLSAPGLMAVLVTACIHGGDELPDDAAGRLAATWEAEGAGFEDGTDGARRCTRPHDIGGAWWYSEARELTGRCERSNPYHNGFLRETYDEWFDRGLWYVWCLEESSETEVNPYTGMEMLKHPYRFDDCVDAAFERG